MKSQSAMIRQGLHPLALARARRANGRGSQLPHGALVRADIDDLAFVFVIFLAQWAVLLKRPAVLLNRPGRFTTSPACAGNAGRPFQ